MSHVGLHFVARLRSVPKQGRLGRSNLKSWSGGARGLAARRCAKQLGTFGDRHPPSRSIAEARALTLCALVLATFATFYARFTFAHGKRQAA